MKLTSEEMRRLYKSQTAQLRDGRAECLSDEAMIRAAEGELSEPEREETADHLMACSDCAEEYRILRVLKPWAEQASDSIYVNETPIESGRTAWAGWSRRLKWIFSAGAPAYAITAALLVVSLACVAWVISLKRENARIAARLNEQLATRDQASQTLRDARRELEAAARHVERQQTEIAELSRSVDDLLQPQVNTPINDLEDQSSRGVGNGPTTVTVPAGTNLFTLILHVADGPAFPDYELEVIDGRGQVLTRAKNLRKNQVGAFNVSLSRQLLPAGQYRLKLYGIRSGNRVAVAEYQMRLNYRKG